MKLKKKEFLSLKQGGMSVAEYRDKFIELSRYAPEDVADDGKKQELFLDGLAGPLQYQLMSHTFPSFQKLVDNAISLEYKRRELGELKRKTTSSGQPENIARPRFTLQQGPIPLWRPEWKFWAAAVPALCSAISTPDAAVPAPWPADTPSRFPAEPSENSSGHSSKAQCTAHPRGQHLLQVW